MSPAAALRRQVRHQNRLFWRSPVAAVFTLAFPLMFLVVVNLVLDDTVDFGEGAVATEQFSTPALAVFAAVSASYTALIMQTVTARELGITKRIRSTPLPLVTYLGGQVLSTVWIAAVGTTMMMVVGRLVYGVDLGADRVPAAIVVFVVGTATFSALGLAVSGMASDIRSASAIANFTVLPVALVSDVFAPLEDPPRWLDTVGSALPLKPFVHAFATAFDPNVDPPAIATDELGVLAVWLVIGALAATRTYRVESLSFNRTPARRARRR